MKTFISPVFLLIVVCLHSWDTMHLTKMILEDIISTTKIHCDFNIRDILVLEGTQHIVDYNRLL